MQNDTDTIRRFVFENEPVRGEIVHLSATWQAVLERHEYPPVLRRLLGELMASAALLASTLKFSGSLIMQMQGSGPVRLLVVECTSDMTMRATAKWDEVPEDGLLSALLGTGRFAITIDPKDEGKQSYQGIVELEGDSVAEVLENYMRQSEQLDTRLWLASDDFGASGMLLQKLPGQPVHDADIWQRATQLGNTLSEKELLKLPASEIIHRLFHEEDVRVFEAAPVSFRCSCSRQRVEQMVKMLGVEEARAILEERGEIEVTCEFCNRQYHLDRVDAEELFASEAHFSSPRTLH